MKISDVKELLDAEVLCGEENLGHDVFSACGCDMMSDVLAAGAGAVIILNSVGGSFFQKEISIKFPYGGVRNSFFDVLKALFPKVAPSSTEYYGYGIDIFCGILAVFLIILYVANPNISVLEVAQNTEKYKGKGTNILFVGRVVPNKRHEDVIAAFYLYQRYYNKNARLFLVGSFDDNDRYCRRLKAYIERLGLDNVIIPGHIKFDEILGYFASADAFLCLSEHEGFCVPLVEAMLFKVPIVAYDSCAVGETMKNGGLLLKDKDLLETAGALDRVITDKGLREQIIGNQRERLEDFRTDRIGRMFEQYLKAFLEK